MTKGTVAIAAFVALAAAPLAHAQEIAGEWRGGYICNQGLTALRVSIVRDGEGDGVTATFRFGPDASNPAVPRGSYSMRGLYRQANKRLVLHAVSWISRPDGYVTVDLSGLMDGSGLRISGEVLGPGCGQFELVREGDEPIA